MNPAIIGLEAMSLIICGIVLYGNIYETTQRNEKRKWYGILIILLIIAMCADMISWIFDGRNDLVVVLEITTFLSTVMCFPVGIAFLQYVYLYVQEKYDIPYGLFRAAIIYNVIICALTIAASLYGVLYHFENGVYAEGDGYTFYLIFNGVSLAFACVVIGLSAKYLGKHDSIAAFSYIVVPVISIVVNIFVPELQMTYPAVSISVLLVYIMMQSEHETILIEKEMISSEQILHDDMTGVLNRRAYTNAIDRIKLQREDMGVIFSDINGLKYTNDNYGHETGDKLICDFVSVLQSNFRKEEIYRISGDEFVILLPHMSKDKLNERVANVRANMSGYDMPMASIGAVFGPMPEVEALIKEAEERMYVAKEETYRSYPQFRR